MMALARMAETARGLGLAPLVLGDALEGEAREMGTVMAGIARSVRAHGQPLPPPAVLLSGGETTVTHRAAARPGMAAATPSSCWASPWRSVAPPDIWAIAGDTDGMDGMDDIAGAIAGAGHAGARARQGARPARDARRP